MYYAPHSLYVKVFAQPEKDEFGRPVNGTGGYSWRYIGECRCDDVSADKQVSVNGVLYKFRYKVVFDKQCDAVDAGTEVRCLRRDGTVRGEGVAKSPLETNALDYRVIWLE